MFYNVFKLFLFCQHRKNTFSKSICFVHNNFTQNFYNGKNETNKKVYRIFVILLLFIKHIS